MSVDKASSTEKSELKKNDSASQSSILQTATHDGSVDPVTATLKGPSQKHDSSVNHVSADPTSFLQSPGSIIEHIAATISNGYYYTPESQSGSQDYHSGSISSEISDQSHAATSKKPEPGRVRLLRREISDTAELQSG